ncbi:MAG TPA: hypothetical protein VHT53_06440 [Candidatus Elarobacter sp.]|nr:hypothetical protein [Candidatus Elarobacter sp.]
MREELERPAREEPQPAPSRGHEAAPMGYRERSGPLSDFILIEREIRALAKTLQLHATEVEHYEEYLDVNEFELALHVLAYAVADGRGSDTALGASRVRSIASLMAFDGDAMLNEMRARVEQQRSLP